MLFSYVTLFWSQISTFQTSFRWPLQLGSGHYSADEWNESTALSVTSTAEYCTSDHLPFLPGKKNRRTSNATSKQQVEGRLSGNANRSTLGGGSTSISGGGGLEPGNTGTFGFLLGCLMPWKTHGSLVVFWGPVVWDSSLDPRKWQELRAI